MDKHGLTLNENSIQSVLKELTSFVEETGLTQEEKNGFIEKTSEILDFYRKKLGENTPVSFSVKNKHRFLLAKFVIEGEAVRPVDEGLGHLTPISAFRRIQQYVIERKTEVTYRFLLGKNIVILRSPEFSTNLAILKEPATIAVGIGILAGILLRLLPESISSFVTVGLVLPVSSVLMNMVSGIMGPVLFLSVITAIGSLDSIEKLNSLGLRVIRRFIGIAALITAVTIAVCLAVFRNFGTGSVSFDFAGIVSMVLSFIPVNLFQPFVENNISQIVILGAVFGTALLLIGDRAAAILQVLLTMQTWLNTVLRYVMKISPLIPMLNLMNIIPANNLGVVVKAWQFLAVVFVCLLLVGAGKMIKVSLHCSVSPRILFRKIRPILSASFSVGTYNAVAQQLGEMEQKKLGVTRTYSDFWLPISFALFRSTTPIIYTAAAFYAAHVCGTEFSAASIVILLLLGVQFSLASPGLVTSLTVLFTQLGIPLETIGVFSVCNVLIKNVVVMFGTMLSCLEELESAFILKEVDYAVLTAEEYK